MALLLTVPYALPYLENAQTLGDRDVFDVTQYSALPTDYLTAVDVNRVWGWTSNFWGGAERRLFPGLIGLLLAVYAWRRGPRANVWIYSILALLAVELSFGMRGSLYAWLFSHVSALHGLRAPARFAIVAQCAFAAVAAMGVRALEDRFGSVNPRFATRLSAGILLLVAVESSNRAMVLTSVSPPDPSAYDVYRAIRAQGPGVVIELPMPTLTTLPGADAVYAFWSASHWHPLVNGYSGYYPHVYAETVARMETFPGR